MQVKLSLVKPTCHSYAVHAQTTDILLKRNPLSLHKIRNSCIITNIITILLQERSPRCSLEGCQTTQISIFRTISQAKGAKIIVTKETLVAFLNGFTLLEALVYCKPSALFIAFAKASYILN